MKKLSLLSISFIIALLLASCGDKEDESTDKDGDGIPNDQDTVCPDSPESFTSTPITDFDGDGCEDAGEDTDDDNDGKNDTEDVDDNNNGLRDITTYKELNEVRYYLYDGSDIKDYINNVASDVGCPARGCIGHELLNDIDMASQSDWEPIGNIAQSRFVRFQTVFEGNGFSILNLNINSNQLSVGLFSYIGKNGTVRNLNLSSTSSSVASYGGVDHVGSLAGRNSGFIDNVSSNLPVSATGNDNTMVGGLIGSGYQDVSINNSGVIQNSYSTGNVNGNNGPNFIGGLAGYLQGVIQNSYSTGEVNGQGGNDEVGGLVGRSLGTIRNSYYSGTADGGAGDDKIGGLVGYFDGVSINNSYSLGAVDGGTGDDKIGRLIGVKSSGNATSNYYNSGSNLDGETITTPSSHRGGWQNQRWLKKLECQ